nr:Fic family protein [Pseudomaricurvus alkylphenolicus]
MILNHKEAIRHLVDNAHRIEASYNQICTLHYLLADGLVAPQYAGKVRDHGVRIGASTYTPLEDSARLDKQLHAIAEKASQIINPFEQSIFLLAHVGYLQAFTDVNKRTSRLSANIALIKHNLVPLSFNIIEKDDYASAMIAIYELNDLQPLIDLYTISYRYSCQQYDVTAESLGFDEIRVRYRQQRRDIIRVIITDELINDALERYINTRATAMIPVESQADFIEDVWEDLNEISPTRIAGLGITQKQLQKWLKLRG